MDWTWGAYESSSVHVSGDKLCVSKVHNTPDYSCAVGSCAFENGIHKWVIAVENVRSMWLGIARGVEEQGGLGSAPGSEGQYMLAFDSRNGDLTTLGDTKPVIEVISYTGFSSCQLVQFELDVEGRTLKLCVDGVLTRIAKNVDVQGVRPYVCMDYDESATIVSRSTALSDSADEIDAEQKKDGFDNALWTETADKKVTELCTSGTKSLTISKFEG